MSTFCGANPARPVSRIPFAHMIDAGMVARSLLRAPQHRRLARLLTALGGFDEASIDQGVPFLVALHDIGKAAPGFQRLVPFLWQTVQAEGFIAPSSDVEWGALSS